MQVKNVSPCSKVEGNDAETACCAALKLDAALVELDAAAVAELPAFVA